MWEKSVSVVLTPWSGRHTSNANRQSTDDEGGRVQKPAVPKRLTSDGHPTSCLLRPC